MWYYIKLFGRTFLAFFVSTVQTRQNGFWFTDAQRVPHLSSWGHCPRYVVFGVFNLVWNKIDHVGILCWSQTSCNRYKQCKSIADTYFRRTDVSVDGNKFDAVPVLVTNTVIRAPQNRCVIVGLTQMFWWKSRIVAIFLLFLILLHVLI